MQINLDVFVFALGYINPAHTLYLSKELQKYIDTNQTLWKSYFQLYFPRLKAASKKEDAKEHFIKTATYLIKQMDWHLRRPLLLSRADLDPSLFSNIFLGSLIKYIVVDVHNSNLFYFTLNDYLDITVSDKSDHVTLWEKTKKTMGFLLDTVTPKKVVYDLLAPKSSTLEDFKEAREAVIFSYNWNNCYKTSNIEVGKMTIQLLACRGENEEAEKLFNSYNVEDLKDETLELPFEDCPLILAARYGIVISVEKILLEKGSVSNENIGLAFRKAAKHGHFGVFEKIWSLAKDNINNIDKGYALQTAVDSEFFGLVEKIWKLIGDSISSYEPKGLLLQEAARHGHFYLIKMLLELPKNNISNIS